ncbi:hypothetical protein AX769_02230 [Frondihabitans sp. PAMC 28766]|nr:hypothetical protein AX769_02230 [Frondihabitans sp. PAMC 28766]
MCKKDFVKDDTRLDGDTGRAVEIKPAGTSTRKLDRAACGVARKKTAVGPCATPRSENEMGEFVSEIDRDVAPMDFRLIS